MAIQIQEWMHVAHYWGLTLLWTFGSDLFILWGRHGKRFPRWFDIHMIGMFLIMCATIFCSSFYFIYYYQRSLLWEERYSYHFKWVITSMIGYLVIMIGGLCARFNMTCKRKIRILPPITVTRRGHAILGFCNWCCFKYTVWIGTGLKKEEYMGTSKYRDLLVYETISFVFLMVCLEIRF
jgi:hypothetical protein